VLHAKVCKEMQSDAVRGQNAIEKHPVIDLLNSPLYHNTGDRVTKTWEDRRDLVAPLVQCLNECLT
jgi:hypothetical protein